MNYINFLIREFINRVKTNTWLPVFFIVFLASCTGPNGTMTKDDIQNAIDDWNQRVEFEMVEGRIIHESPAELDSIRFDIQNDLDHIAKSTDSKSLDHDCMQLYWTLEGYSTLETGIKLDSIYDELNKLRSRI